MGYVTTINGPTNITTYFTGSKFDRCPSGLVKRYVSGNYAIKYGYVTSYRGRRDYSKCRSFERFRYEVTGQTKLHHCNLSNYVDGGEVWMVRQIQGHVLTVPTLDLRHDKFIISQEEERYRDYQIAKLYAKANEPRFGMATFLAELGESIYYVSDAVKTLLRITKFTKSIIHKGANPHEAWLEWRYAVQPLMLTVQDVLEALQEHRPKEKVQAYKKYEPVEKTTSHLFTYSYGSILFKCKTTTEFRCGAALWVNDQRDMSPWGTGLNDVIQAGWEIVPLSFVFDWFINVNLWLSSIRDTNLEVGERYCTLVKNKKAEVWVDESGSNQGEFYTKPTEDDPLVVTGLHISRIVGDAVAPPVLPCLDPSKLSLVRRLDALSLLTGVLTKLLRR